MITHRDPFPLATGLARKLDGQVADLVGGRNTEILEQVTPTTAELLKYWFETDYCDIRPLNFHEGQRTAILNIIYAHEVLHTRGLRDLYEAVAPEALLDGRILGEVTRAQHQYPKYAAKMATGTGKTWVLNALLVWQYLNHVAAADDDRFTSNFLLVAPGLIVYDRLLDSFLGKERGGEREFESSDICENRTLFIPDNYRENIFEFVQSSVTTKADIGRKVTGDGLIAITNWHLLAGIEDPMFVPDAGTEDSYVNSQQAAESFLPLTPGTSAGHSLDVLDRAYQRGRPLESLRALPDLLVFNDEAHHIHEIRKAGEVTEVEWQKSLSEIASTKGHRFVQVDFSATPYNEVGSGRSKSKSYFLHVVVDFDLKSAMSAGLVKALALDKRKEVASLPLDFRAERDEQGRVSALSGGQRTMLRAGVKKLAILEEHFARTNPDKHPKLLVVCEDTSVTGHVVAFLKQAAFSDDAILAVDSNAKGEMSAAQWDIARQRLFDVDRHAEPRVIVSVLMLREGFDVNNICVIVPLRATKASILLEQTIGRGLRLMWRGDEQIDELKRQTRERFRKKLEPTNFFDVLFVVEHPAYAEFYDDLLASGLAGEVGDEADKTNPTGDLESIDLRQDFAQYDFLVPLIVRDAEEELKAPTLDPLTLPASKFQLDWLLTQIGKGDKFFSEDAQTGTQYGDYRVDSGVMTATGYNDYLSRMTTRIGGALGSGITRSARKYSEATRFPFLQTYRPLLTGWLETYIRQRLFNQVFDPLADENWRILLVDDVAREIAGAFATALTQAQESYTVEGAQVTYRRMSEVKTISVRSSSAVEVTKSIYPKLPVPRYRGGLERLFMEWTNQDTRVNAFVKIHEYRHDFLRRPYLKADGMPAQYSPDFLVRTDTDCYVVETKAQSALSDENVRRKQRAAVAWVEQINSLPDSQRADLQWHYVLLGEATVKDWRAKNARVTELLDFARLRAVAKPVQDRLL